MKTFELAKAFIVEALFFQKPFEGSIMPNWMIGVLVWANILVIVFAMIEIA